MMVVVVLISSWYWESRNGWIDPLDTIRVTPWINQMTTSPKQKAKKGARLASLAANPAKVSKNPTLLDTSVGMRMCLDSLVIQLSLQDARLAHIMPPRSEEHTSELQS